jgi:hypothetical protein
MRNPLGRGARDPRSGNRLLSIAHSEGGSRETTDRRGRNKRASDAADSIKRRKRSGCGCERSFTGKLDGAYASHKPATLIDTCGMIPAAKRMNYAEIGILFYARAAISSIGALISRRMALVVLRKRR